MCKDKILRFIASHEWSFVLFIRLAYLLLDEEGKKALDAEAEKLDEKARKRREAEKISEP